MYIGDINFDFDYSGMCDYKSYSPPCKAEFSIYGSFEEMAELRAELRGRLIWNSGSSNVLPRVLLDEIREESQKFLIDKIMEDVYMPRRKVDYLGLTTTNYSLIKVPMIIKVIFHNPATIVYWQDKTRTVVKCKDGETFDKEKGLAMCISKKLLGDDFHSEFRKYTEDEEK